MKTAIATLEAISPYSQSRHYVLPKKQGESAADYEARSWRERLHINEQGQVYIPPMAFKNCLSEAAKYLSLSIPGKGKATYTKHFEAGVLVVEPLVLPIKKAKVEGEWLFVPSDGRRGSGSRVEKCFPLIPAWAGEVSFMILDETVLNKHVAKPEITVFEHILREAGSYIGIGRFRPRNNGYYGRFAVKAVNVE
jgi:hypothetical protein